MSPPSREAHSSPRSGRALIAGAVAGIVALAALSVVLWRGLKPEPQSRPAPEKSAARAPQVPEWAPAEGLVLPSETRTLLDAGRQAAGGDVPAPAPHPEAETVDLFSGPAPEVVWRGHDIVERGGRLHSKRVKELYELGKQNPGDARPHIVLALDSMNRGWYDFAVSHYRRAVTENPQAAKDPRVMRDLLKMAGREHQAEKAREAIAEIYGAGALAPARAALDEATSSGDEKRAAHLRELISSLEQAEAQ